MYGTVFGRRTEVVHRLSPGDRLILVPDPPGTNPPSGIPQLPANQVIQVDTGCIVAFDDTVDYDIQFVGGIKTALFGGEGFFLASLTGPGHVVIQSMTLQKLRRELAPGRTGGDEHSTLGALGGIFGSED